MNATRTLMVALTALTSVLLLGSPAHAQRGRSGFGFRGQTFSGIALVANPTVRTELALDAEQTKKAGELNETYRDELRTEMQGLGFNREAFEGLSDEERQQKIREMGQKRAEVSRKLDEKYRANLAEALHAEQMRRLQQISWQAAGAAALSDPALVTALGINKEQQDQIAAIGQEYDQKSRELFRGGAQGDDGDRESRFEKMRQIGQERDAKQLSVLNEEQQKEMETLKGKAFDVSQLGPRAGQRGGRRAAN
jgi:hypothetical protein